jgi:hypothetical protein
MSASTAKSDAGAMRAHMQRQCSGNGYPYANPYANPYASYSKSKNKGLGAKFFMRKRAKSTRNNRNSHAFFTDQPTIDPTAVFGGEL